MRSAGEQLHLLAGPLTALEHLLLRVSCSTVAVAALSSRVAEERGEAVGDVVGYSIRGDR
jgi:hypothetical protein